MLFLFRINEYCPPNETLVPHIYADKGVSQCFAETISSSVTLGFMLLFGTIQFFFYRKYAIEVQHYTLPYSRFFGLQVKLVSSLNAHSYSITLQLTTIAN